MIKLQNVDFKCTEQYKYWAASAGGGVGSYAFTQTEMVVFVGGYYKVRQSRKWLSAISVVMDIKCIVATIIVVDTIVYAKCEVTTITNDKLLVGELSRTSNPHQCSLP